MPTLRFEGFSTWKDWERFHKEPFVARVRELVAKYGS